MRLIVHPLVHDVSVLKSSQIAYSELINCVLLYTAAELRRASMLVYPTRDDAKKYNAEKVIPAIEACPPAARLIAKQDDLLSDGLWLSGVPVWFGYAHTTRTTKSRPCGVILCDEVDEWPPDGAAKQNLRGRQRTFVDRLTLRGSTPEFPEGITEDYERSAHRYRYMVPCPITGHFFEPWDLSLLRWEGGLGADPDDVRLNTWMQSPFDATATGRIREVHKHWMMLNGVWCRQGEEVESTGQILHTLGDGPRAVGAEWLSRVDGDELRDAPRTGRRMLAESPVSPEASACRERLGVRIVGGDEGVAGRVPPAKTVGFRINTLASLIDAEGWGGVAGRFVETRGKPGRDWYKDVLGQLPASEGESLSVRMVREHCRPVGQGGYELGTIPAPCAALYGGVDVQQNCVYVTVWGFGPFGQPLGLVWAERIGRDLASGLRDVASVLPTIRGRVRRPEGGGSTEGSLRVLGWAVDSGAFTDEVYRVCRLLRARGVRAQAIKGVDQGRNYPYKYTTVEDVTDRRGRKRKLAEPERLLLINGSRFKSYLHTLMLPGGDPEGAGDVAKDGALFAPSADETGVRLPDFRSGWDDVDGQRSRDALDFLKQITAEHRVRERKGGREVLVWQPKRSHAANHYLDCSVYAIGFAHAEGVEQLTVSQCESARATALAGGGDEVGGGGGVVRSSASRPARRPKAGPSRFRPE